MAKGLIWVRVTGVDVLLTEHAATSRVYTEPLVAQTDSGIRLGALNCLQLERAKQRYHQLE